MPYFDCKGPEGKGPKTGMKLGKCKKTKSDTNEYPMGRPYGNGRRKNRKIVEK